MADDNAELKTEEEERKMMHQLEIHREVLCSQIHARRLLDKMRSRCIFTKDECEEILNEVVNPNSSTKAGCFLDNLQRKGQGGYSVFLECLGEMYPNLYELLTGHGPEAPVNPVSSAAGFVYKLPYRVGDVIGDLSQEVEDLHRKLDFSNQLRIKQEQEIQSLNESLKIAIKKAERYDKVEKARRRAELKVSVLDGNIRTMLGNSLLHKEEKDRAMETLREKIKEVHELERRLQQAKDQAEVRRQIWHETCLDKQQLKVDREEMLQRMSTMEEELKQAKRNEDVRTSMTNNAEPNKQIDQHTQATINILEEELKNYKEKCEELAGNLLQARNDLHRRDTEFEKCKSENEELKQKEASVKKMAELFKMQYNSTWQDLIRVKQQRNRAIDERDLAQMDSKAHLDQLHKHQEMMHQQLQNLQSIHLFGQVLTNSTQQCEMNDVEISSRRGSSESKSRPECESFYSSTSGVSTQTCSDSDLGTGTHEIDVNMEYVMPLTHGENLSTSNFTDLRPLQRPRVYNIAPKGKITEEVLDQVYNKDTFPDESFSYTPNADDIGDSIASDLGMQRHHQDSFGDSRKVHPGSIKSPHLLSLWDNSSESDDEDLDANFTSFEEDKEDTMKEFSPHLYRRSQSWNNLLCAAKPENTGNVYGQPTKHQQTRASSVKTCSLSKSLLKK